MVNLPVRSRRSSTGASAWAEDIIANMANPVASGGSYDRSQELHQTQIQWQQDSDGEMYGQIKLVGNDGTTFRTQRFLIPPGFDVRGEATRYEQRGQTIRVRFEHGGGFDVDIEHMQRQIEPATMGYNAWGTPLITTAEARAQQLTGGMVFDEGFTFGGMGSGKVKKKPYGITLPKNMKCAFCNEHIHFPEKLIELLTEKGAKDYLKYCRKSKTKPQLFCCDCYDFIEDKPKIYGALNKLNKQLEKFVKINEKEKELKIREKELDKELKAIRKTKA